MGESRCGSSFSPWADRAGTITGSSSSDDPFLDLAQPPTECIRLRQAAALPAAISRTGSDSRRTYPAVRADIGGERPARCGTSGGGGQVCGSAGRGAGLGYVVSGREGEWHGGRGQRAREREWTCKRKRRRSRGRTRRGQDNLYLGASVRPHPSLRPADALRPARRSANRRHTSSSTSFASSPTRSSPSRHSNRSSPPADSRGSRVSWSSSGGSMSCWCRTSGCGHE